MSGLVLAGAVDASAPVILSLLMVAAGLAFVRLIKGPTLADRVVAIEVIGAIVAGTIAVWAVSRDEPVPIDVALVFALVSFMGSLGSARFIAKGARDA